MAFVIGTVSGLFVGLWLARAPTAAAVLDPFIKGLNSMPRVILAPIFAVWFGLGPASKIALGVTLVFFIVFFNVYQGVREVNPTVLASARMLGATNRQLMRTVGPPLHTTRHCRCIAAVARLLENLCDQLMDRRIRHAASQRFELCKEPPQLLPECFIIPHRRIFSTCLVNFHVFIHTTHRCKLRVCASADGGTQNGRKWNFLTRIVTQMQVIQHRHNFLRGKVSRF